MVTCRRCRRRLNRAAGGPWPPCWRWPSSPPGLPGRRCPAPHRPRSAWCRPSASRSPRARDYTGRIQATNRVNLIARVSAFLDEVLFTEGRGGQEGRPALPPRAGPVPRRRPGQAGVGRPVQGPAPERPGRAEPQPDAAQGRRPASNPPVDVALANEQALQAQVLGAEAQLQQAQINLDYTEIRAPIDGKIGRTAVTAGNYVSPSTGVLVSIVSQDPMYVVFPVSTRIVIELQRAAPAARMSALRHPPAPARRQHVRPRRAALDFVDNTVAGNTDTMILRGVIANPRLTRFRGGIRALVDGELVTVILEDAEPTEALAVPRAAVLTDQEGDYVYVVGADNKAQQRRVKLGQSTPALAAVAERSDRGRERRRRRHPARPARPGRGSPGPAAQRPAARRAAAGGRPMISAIFIRRPRLAVVIAIVITLAGAHRHDAHPGRAVPRHRAAARAGDGELSRRLGRGGRGRGRPAARGADRRRRQDDLHEVDQRQRRQLQPHRLASRSAPIPTPPR